jgi:DNA invertase Pin-like site-specific DNA recombinase
MRIGVARVGTRDQNPEAQQEALCAVGCERIFTDTASGKLVQVGSQQVQQGMGALADALPEG